MTADSRLTQAGIVMGSPSYMPPEQASGRQGDVGPASDVYSLGAMLYELLTGRPPFRGATPAATLRDVMENEPAAPRQLKADIPPDLETICLKCLEKSPTLRYPTARALAEELDRFLKGEPIQARPVGTVRKVVSWARRHPGVLTTAASAVMVALAFGVFYLLEENAFLRARAEDPTLMRDPWEKQKKILQITSSPDFQKLPVAEQQQFYQQHLDARFVGGPRRETALIWLWINFFAIIAGAVVFFTLYSRARGLSFKECLEYLRPHAPPIGEWARTFAIFAIGAGLILVGCGVMGMVTAIQAYVWERGLVSFLFGVMGFVSIQMGLLFLVVVILDYHLEFNLRHVAQYPSRQLTAEQIESIRKLPWKITICGEIQLVPGRRQALSQIGA